MNNENIQPPSTCSPLHRPWKSSSFRFCMSHSQHPISNRRQKASLECVDRKKSPSSYYFPNPITKKQKQKPREVLFEYKKLQIMIPSHPNCIKSCPLVTRQGSEPRSQVKSSQVRSDAHPQPSPYLHVTSTPPKHESIDAPAHIYSFPPFRHTFCGVKSEDTHR